MVQNAYPRKIPFSSNWLRLTETHLVVDASQEFFFPFEVSKGEWIRCEPIGIEAQRYRITVNAHSNERDF